MPGVNSVQPRVSGGLLDTVLKGVEVARNVYGIKADMAQSDALDQKTEQQKTAFDQQQQGFAPQSEKAVMARWAGIAPAPEDGSVPQGSYLQKFVGEAKPSLVTPFKDSIQVKSVDANGNPVWTWMNRGDAPVAAYEPPAKDTTPRFIPTTLDNGNIGSFNATTGQVTDTGHGAGAKPKPTAPALDPNAPPDPKAVAAERKQMSDLFLKGGQRSEVGRLKTKVDGAEALETLLNNHPDFMVNPQLQTELAMGVANLVAPGTATQAMVEHMDPQTRGTFIANLMQKVTDEPYSANNPAFVKSFAETIAREKGTAQDQIGRAVQQAQYAAPNLFKADPQGFFGLTGTKPGDFQKADDQSLVYQPKVLGKKTALQAEGGGSGTAIAAPASVPAPHAQDNVAVKWAQANLMSPNADTATKARAILQVNGVK